MDISLGIGLEIWQEKHAYFQNAQDFINVNYFENILQLLRVVVGVFREARSINTDSSCHTAVLVIYGDLRDPRGWSVRGTEHLSPSCQPVKSARSENHNKGRL